MLLKIFHYNMAKPLSSNYGPVMNNIVRTMTTGPTISKFLQSEWIQSDEHCARHGQILTVI